MPKPISTGLRTRIVDTDIEGEFSDDDVAERFKVGRATVSRVLSRKREARTSR